MKKFIPIAAMLLFSGAGLLAQTNPELKQSAGWLESAYAEWSPVDHADSYNVYYTGEGITDQRIDDQLIRSYGDYFRADVLGLKPGKYVIRIVPVIAGEEGAATVTSSVEVKAHDRAGFAFSNGMVPGAYNTDGTLKDKARVVYISENTKNTVSIDVVTSSKGAITTCEGLQAILDGYKKGYDDRPLAVRFIGQITDLKNMYNGDIVVENGNVAKSPITLEGVGEDAVFDGWGVRIKNASNIEIRNVGTMNCDSSEGDNISLQQENDYIWVHNCDFFYGHAGSDSDQAKGDGALDCKKSNYVTFSYNHFWDSGKSNLLGLSEGSGSDLYITYHHNWYDHSDSRHPRVRYYSAHVYNNYYDGNAKYGVGSTLGSSVFVENNYFRNCKNPMMISMQGTDTKMGTDEKNSPTFSKEQGGIIKAFGNIMVENFTFVPYSSSNTVHFDAYVASKREEIVPSAVTSKSGGNSYDNFDTNESVMYEYVADAATDVVKIVTRYSGRINGGDFKWEFNNSVDDSSYDVNKDLKNALISYKSKLVAIQGDGEISGGGNGGSGGNGDGNGDDNNGGGNIDGDVVHNFTSQGLNSEFFSISGNLSDSKGTVSYNGLTLTQCLKMESSTSVGFSVAEDCKLTLVLDSDFSKKIKINDVSYTASNGFLYLDLSAGDYKITKGDTGNLFYIKIDMTKSGVQESKAVEARLYPNPVADQLYISTEADVQSVEVYSVSGIIVGRYEGSIVSIDMGTLPSGIYLVRVNTDKGTIQQRVVRR